MAAHSVRSWLAHPPISRILACTLLGTEFRMKAPTLQASRRPEDWARVVVCATLLLLVLRRATKRAHVPTDAKPDTTTPVAKPMATAPLLKNSTSPEPLLQRLRSSFISIYLTLTSIIQGVVFGSLVVIVAAKHLSFTYVG